MRIATAAAARVAVVLVFSVSAAALLQADEKPKDAKEPAWRELFNGKDLTGWRQSDYGGGPEVTVEEGKIVIPLAERLAGITYDAKDADKLPKTNYEVELEARRVQGTDFFVGLTFPMGESHASLILGGWGGTVCGISSLDGDDANHNETRKLIRFKKGQWYKVRLRVEPERIQAWLDDQPLVDVKTAGKRIDIRPEIGPSKPLGLATFATQAEVKSIRLRELQKTTTK
jgi:hypothetical protein